MSSYVPRGHEVWATRDYGGEGKALNLTPTRLGKFVYALLSMGGGIQSSYVMSKDFPGSYVQMTIHLPEGMRESLEVKGGVALEKPPGGFRPA